MDSTNTRVVPGKVQAIGILHLIGGVLNLVNAMIWGLNGVLGVTYIFGVLFCCPAVLLGAIGIVELVSGVRHLSSDHRALQAPRMVGVAEIVSILGCNVISMTFGILTLVFLGDPEVDEYYARNQLPG